MPVPEHEVTPLRKQELLGEAVGTFLIVCLGTGFGFANLLADVSLPIGSIAILAGINVSIAVATLQDYCSAHFNPAISVAMSIYRQFPARKILPYCLAQLAGAMLGSLVNYGLFRELIFKFERSQGLNRVNAFPTARLFGEYFDISVPAALFAEALGTCLLTVVVFALTHRENKTKREWLPVLIGGTVSVLVSILGPLTQAGLNPARDFGPRVIAYLCGWKQVAFQHAWVYIVGPLIGAMLGSTLVERIMFPSNHFDQERIGRPARSRFNLYMQSKQLQVATPQQDQEYVSFPSDIRKH